MRPGWLPGTILTLVLTGPTAPAVDLTRIERTIAREPVYQTKTAKYCLLVFALEGKSRAWVVLDGAPHGLVKRRAADKKWLPHVGSRLGEPSGAAQGKPLVTAPSKE